MSNERLRQCTLDILKALDICDKSTISQYSQARKKVHKVLVEFEKELLVKVIDHLKHCPSNFYCTDVEVHFLEAMVIPRIQDMIAGTLKKGQKNVR